MRHPEFDVGPNDHHVVYGALSPQRHFSYIEDARVEFHEFIHDLIRALYDVYRGYMLSKMEVISDDDPAETGDSATRPKARLA